MTTEQAVMAVIRASRPNFRNPHDKVVYALHASFLASGYVLTATGPPAFAEDVLSSPSTDEVGVDGWDQYEDNYAFVYTNPNNGSKKLLMKCLAMNNKLLVDVLSEGDSEPLHLEINVEEYIADNGGTNYSSQYKDLGKLVTIVDKEILGKLNGPSKSSSTTKASSSEVGLRAERNQPNVGVTEPQGSQPYYPSGYVVPPIYPSIGGSDLFPGPGAGMYPSRGDFGSGGGMFVGPDHPLFGGRTGGQQPGFPGSQPGVPPGARFDPYGPPGVPGFEPNRFTRDPRRPGGGTHPDLEHFGSDNDFI